ncbi:MAG: glycosyltransferase [Planctomycetota bacterium]
MGIFPSLCFETHGLVLDECIELGLPCIVTGIGVLPGRAGGAALVVPPRDPAALAAAIEKVLARPSLRDELRASLPALPPTLREHQESLSEVCARARSESPHDTSPTGMTSATPMSSYCGSRRSSAICSRAPCSGISTRTSRSPSSRTLPGSTACLSRSDSQETPTTGGPHPPAMTRRPARGCRGRRADPRCRST